MKEVLLYYKKNRTWLLLISEGEEVIVDLITSLYSVFDAESGKKYDTRITDTLVVI
jgi:hypothetical protein